MKASGRSRAGESSPSIRAIGLARARALALAAFVIVPSAAGAQKFSPADFQQLAALIERGQLAQAESRLEAGLKTEPNSLPALRLLGSVYRQQEKLPRAEEVLERAVRLSQQKDSEAMLALAEVKFLLRKREEALRLTAGLTSLRPRDARVLYSAGRLLRENAATGEAVRLLERAHGLAPANPAVTTELILADLDAGSAAPAGTLLEHFLKQAAFADLMQAGARFGEAGQFAPARKAFERAAQLRPSSTDAHFNLAFALYREGNAAAALQALDRLDSSHAQTGADYYHLRAKIELALKNTPAAITDYEKALSLAPDNESICVELGLLFFSHETFSRSQEVLEACARRLPESLAVLTALALNDLGQGKNQEARDGFRKVLGLRPEADPAREALAFLLLVAGELPEARKVLEERTSAGDTDFYLHYLRAVVLQRIDAAANQSAILESLDRAIARNPRFAQSFLMRGRIRAGQGNLDSALADYQAAAESDPAYAQTYFHLAQVYLKMGKKDEAEAAQQRFASLHKEREEREQKNQIENQIFQSLQ